MIPADLETYMPQRNSATCDTREILRQAGLRPPKMMTFSITGACNLACLHCWVDAELASASMHVAKESLLRLVMEYREIGGEGVRFTGGEPLLHPAWLELLQLSRGIGFNTVAMQTNAILFKEEDVAALRDLDCPGLSLQISLDGAKAATHDLVRGEGAFQGVMQGLARLAEGGLGRNISLFFTEMRHNLDEIPALLELAESLGIGSVSTGALVLCGRAEKESMVAPPSPDQYFQLLHRYETDPGFHGLYERIGTTAAIEWLKGDAPRSECCTFVENPYLTPDGGLYPCVLCHTDEYAVHRVFDKGLRAAFAEGAPLWSVLLKTSHRRTESIPECRDCPGESTCAGGCMGRAWGSCGDLMAADDRCELRRTIYNHNKSRQSTPQNH
jgi:radical SAM protein with 4Fe4S-binding SPASM domain